MSVENTIYDAEENRQFYRNMPDWDFGAQRVAISSPKHPAEDTGIRLYCTMFRQAWSLQIRGFFQNRDYKKGKTWYLANASLGVDDLRALRDSCNAALAEMED